MLNKEWFVPVLDGALKKYSLDCSVVRGFRACVLNPLNPENTDYLECLGKKLSINALSRNPSMTTKYRIFEETGKLTDNRAQVKRREQ
jgi:hypothetical protein